MIYGHNGYVDRKSLWADMRGLAISLKDKLGCKWETSTWSEAIRKEGVVVLIVWLQEILPVFVFDIDMEDLVTKGIWFSWSNRRGGMGDSRSKFDRAVVNGHWLDCFTECEACLLSPGVSDHCLLMVTVLKEVSCKKLFKFLNFWINHNQFQEKEGQSWSQPMAGSAMLCLAQKWKRLKPNLKDLNSHFYSDMSKEGVCCEGGFGSVANWFMCILSRSNVFGVCLFLLVLLGLSESC